MRLIPVLLRIFRQAVGTCWIRGVKAIPDSNLSLKILVLDPAACAREHGAGPWGLRWNCEVPGVPCPAQPPSDLSCTCLGGDAVWCHSCCWCSGWSFALLWGLLSLVTSGFCCLPWDMVVWWLRLQKEHASIWSIWSAFLLKIAGNASGSGSFLYLFSFLGAATCTYGCECITLIPLSLLQRNLQAWVFPLPTVFFRVVQIYAIPGAVQTCLVLGNAAVVLWPEAAPLFLPRSALCASLQHRAVCISWVKGVFSFTGVINKSFDFLPTSLF